MNKTCPLVSIIVTTYNEGKIISKCLSRIRNQTYPQSKIEIILVDDDSTDKTVEIAKEFNARVVRSGFRNIERAKSIGLENAKGELILLLDADVFLVPMDYIEKTVSIFLHYPRVAAAQTVRWSYSRKDHMINRYCNLFGINNPLVMFLGKRGTLMATEKAWFDKRVVIEKGDYFEIVEFDEKNLPTLGSHGYMVRKTAITNTSWKPFFFHLDTTLEMVKQGMNQFALTTLAVQHDYVHSFWEYHKKAYRNIYLFFKYREYRVYDYNISRIRLLGALFLMVTLVIPLYQSFVGYVKKADLAWFLHPILCVTVPVVYFYVYVLWNIERLFKKTGV